MSATRAQFYANLTPVQPVTLQASGHPASSPFHLTTLLSYFNAPQSLANVQPSTAEPHTGKVLGDPFLSLSTHLSYHLTLPSCIVAAVKDSYLDASSKHPAVHRSIRVLAERRA